MEALLNNLKTQLRNSQKEVEKIEKFYDKEGILGERLDTINRFIGEAHDEIERLEIDQKELATFENKVSVKSLAELQKGQAVLWRRHPHEWYVGKVIDIKEGGEVEIHFPKYNSFATGYFKTVKQLYVAKK